MARARWSRSAKCVGSISAATSRSERFTASSAAEPDPAVRIWAAFWLPATYRRSWTSGSFAALSNRGSATCDRRSGRAQVALGRAARTRHLAGSVLYRARSEFASLPIVVDLRGVPRAQAAADVSDDRRPIDHLGTAARDVRVLGSRSLALATPPVLGFARGRRFSRAVHRANAPSTRARNRSQDRRFHSRPRQRTQGNAQHRQRARLHPTLARPTARRRGRPGSERDEARKHGRSGAAEHGRPGAQHTARPSAFGPADRAASGR